MKRIYLILVGLLAVTAGGSGALFAAGDGPLASVGAWLGALLSGALLLALVGLARDPGARAAAVERFTGQGAADRAGSAGSAAPAIQRRGGRTHVDATAQVDATQGYVAGNRAARRAAARKR